ncbi:cyanocobalamin reductase / alkylcobalamin dealkylase isoform X4 [Rhincodon typus]|uniref:cyanocobalamin reductase / alkylcobalamin dealkylase isoform X4 n=1 Tax=Rhincodon typus TaxID=259920 RepID=UPI00202E2C0C|nr:cyanocobalamin reductase / alkylcobalamin dealkylase isoform X4 [Rhincodon typus]
MAVEIHQRLSEWLGPLGFQCAPFKIAWYNAIIQLSFHLQYQDDTLAFVILSTPQMFEKAFKPYIADKLLATVRDPIDECVVHYFTLLKKNFSDHRIEAIHDFEMFPNRKPKILAQTAAHVAAAAYYYQMKDVQQNPWGEKMLPDLPSFSGILCLFQIFSTHEDVWSLHSSTLWGLVCNTRSADIPRCPGPST